MIPYQNCEIFASVLFFFVTKLLALTYPHFHRPMLKSNLDSIPENDDEKQSKWVDKKKHDVLKVKYKCLKKLFQVYDASMIAYIPDVAPTDQTKHLRRKRSHNSKADANVDTTELEHGVTESTDLTVTSTLTETASVLNMEHSGQKTNKKPTRFQKFVHRVFGLRIEEICPLTRAHSETTMFRNKRRRKPLRFGRSRRLKATGIRSEDKNPMILSYIQSVQKNCLMDTTPRQCPFAGCDMKLYGIINYNDHLNLCHFPQRKHSCTYCHEGFESDSEKYKHEDCHIGINKLNHVESTNQIKISKTDTRASDTQTDSEILYPEKCKRVSFADNPTTGVSRMKSRQSESILRKTNSKQFLSIFRKKRSESSLNQIRTASNEDLITDSETLTKVCTKLNSDSPNDSFRSNSFCSSNNISKAANSNRASKTSKFDKASSKIIENSDTNSTSFSSNRPLRNGYHQDESYKDLRSRNIDVTGMNRPKEHWEEEIPTKLVAHPEEQAIQRHKTTDEYDNKIKYIPAIIEWSSDEMSNLRTSDTAKTVCYTENTAHLEWKPNKAAKITNDRPISSCTLKCNVCFMPFDHRWQLNSHYNTEHRAKKVSPHSPNGSTVKSKKSGLEFLNREDGKITIESVDDIEAKRHGNSARRFDDNFDACTNIVYESTSEAEIKKVLELSRLSNKTSKSSYKWVRTNDGQD